MDPGSHAEIMERLDGHERRLGELEHRELTLNERVKDLEGDRQLVRTLAGIVQTLAQQVDKFARQAKELADGVDVIAERAVEKVLSRREEERWQEQQRELERRRAGWKFRLSWILACLSVAGFVVDHVHRLF